MAVGDLAKFLSKYKVYGARQRAIAAFGPDAVLPSPSLAPRSAMPVAEIMPTGPRVAPDFALSGRYGVGPAEPLPLAAGPAAPVALPAAQAPLALSPGPPVTAMGPGPVGPAMPMGGPAPVAPTGPIAGPTAAAATAEPLALPAGFAPTAGDAGLGNFGPAGVTLGQRLAGKGPQGAGLLGRLGLGASEASDLGLLARLGNLQGLKGLGARAGLGFAVSAGGEALGEWIKSQDFAKQPLAPVTGTGPGGLPMAANVEEAQARVAPASGDVLGNMAKGAGIGGGLSAFLGPEAIPFGAAAGAGVAGIGTALNDIFGSGKENPPVAVQPAGMGEARTGPVPLRQLMGDMNLPDKYQSRVMDQYNDALTYAKAQGGIEVPDPSDPTGKKTVQLTDPAKIEQVVWRQAAQMVPLLKQQAAQEQQATEAQAAQHADFIRRTIMLQAGLAQAAPQLMNPAFFTVNPGERQQAMADIQAIPAMLAMGEQGDANRQLAGQIQSKQLAQLLGPTPEQANESAYQQLIAQRQRLAQAKQEHPELYPQSSSTSGADELLNPSNG